MKLRSLEALLSLLFNDAKNAAKEINGVSLDGKRIKLEQARRPPSLKSGRKQEPPSFSRTRGASRILKWDEGAVAEQEAILHVEGT